jgi:hypothetical protein
MRDLAGEYGSWDVAAGIVPSGGIVTVASLGITSPGFANCMMLVPVDVTGGGAGRVQINGSIPDLAVGDSRNYRAYFAALYPNMAIDDNNWHPADIFDAGGTGNAWYEAFKVHIPDNTDDFNFGAIQADENSVDIQSGVDVYIDRQRFYAAEYRYVRTSSTAMELTDFWIFDDAGVVVADNSNLTLDGGDTLEDRNLVIVIPTGGSLDNWRMGSNGWGPAPHNWPDNHPWGCWAGVAIVDNTDQIGPWNGSY